MRVNLVIMSLRGLLCIIYQKDKNKIKKNYDNINNAVVCFIEKQRDTYIVLSAYITTPTVFT